MKTLSKALSVLLLALCLCGEATTARSAAIGVTRLSNPSDPDSGPAIPNPSFEADTFTTYPGFASDNGNITGWTYTGNVGLNPEVGNSPFANNGQTPDGAQVAFLNGNSTLATTITGLTPGSSYLVSFRCNSRAGYDAPTPTVSVNGATPQTFKATPPVGGTNAYYSAGITFIAPDAVAPASTSTASLVIANMAAGDTTLLVDNFSVASSSGFTFALRITSAPPPSPVTVGKPYSYAITSSSTQPVSYSITSGSLPPGLHLSSNGVLSGTPTSAGTGSFRDITITASNGFNTDATQTFPLSAVTAVSYYLAGFGLTGPNAALTADPNADGVTNLMAYALGLNPTVQSANSLPQGKIKNYNGVSYESIAFTRSSVATDLTYIVEVSSDLSHWTTVATSSGGAATTGPGFVGETGTAPNYLVEARDTQLVGDPNAPRRFLRLRVTSP